MYEYKFVRVDMKGFFKLQPNEDCESLVNRYAKEGWRLMQVLAPPVAGHGTASYYEFVFERKLQADKYSHL